MVCPAGYHAHGGDTKCHPIKKPHDNPKTQRYHDMEIQDTGAYGTSQEDSGYEEEDSGYDGYKSLRIREKPSDSKGKVNKPKRTPAEEARHTRTVKRIKNLIKNLTSGRNGKSLFMFWPITMLMSVLDYKDDIVSHKEDMDRIKAERMARIESEAEHKKKDDAQRVYEEDFKNMSPDVGFDDGSAYVKAMEELSESFPLDEDITEESVNDAIGKITAEYQNAYDALGKRKKMLVERYGGDTKKARNMIVFTKEYQHWKAYEDYLSKCESTAETLKNGITRRTGRSFSPDIKNDLMTARAKARERYRNSRKD